MTPDIVEAIGQAIIIGLLVIFVCIILVEAISYGVGRLKKFREKRISELLKKVKLR